MGFSSLSKLAGLQRSACLPGPSPSAELPVLSYQCPCLGLHQCWELNSWLLSSTLLSELLLQPLISISDVVKLARNENRSLCSGCRLSAYNPREDILCGTKPRLCPTSLPDLLRPESLIVHLCQHQNAKHTVGVCPGVLRDLRADS